MQQVHPGISVGNDAQIIGNNYCTVIMRRILAKAVEINTHNRMEYKTSTDNKDEDECDSLTDYQLSHVYELFQYDVSKEEKVTFLVENLDIESEEETKQAPFILSKTCLNIQDIKAALSKVLSGDLIKHATSDGVKAITKGYPDDMSKWTERSGLQFDIPNVAVAAYKVNNEILLENNAAIYLAAIIEYMIAELLELSGNCASVWYEAQDVIVDRSISGIDMYVAIKNDEEILNSIGGNIDILSHCFEPRTYIPLAGDVRSLINLFAKTKKSFAFIGKNETIEKEPVVTVRDTFYRLILDKKYKGSPPLLKACQTGTPMTVRDARLSFEICKEENGNGKTALYYAGWYGKNEDIAQYLISIGGDENEYKQGKIDFVSFQNSMYTREFPHADPVIVACEKGRLNDVETFIKSGTVKDVNKEGKDSNGYIRTLLGAASRYDQYEIVQYLLSLPGMDVGVADSDGWTPTHYAAQFNEKNLDLMKSLLNHKTCSIGAVNKKSKSGKTALDCTQYNRGPFINEIILLLKSKGAE
eukprot:g1573.t1